MLIINFSMLLKCTLLFWHYASYSLHYAAVPPSSPTSLRVVEKTVSSVTISWEPPTYLGTGTLTYKVYISFENQPRTEVTNVVSGRSARIPSKKNVMYGSWEYKCHLIIMKIILLYLVIYYGSFVSRTFPLGIIITLFYTLRYSPYSVLCESACQ